ncbi:MAG: OmpA family protein [Flavobacteriales bacterium]
MRITLHILILSLLLTGSAFSQTKMVLKDVTKVSGELNSEAEESLPLFSPNGRLYFVRTLFDQNVGGAQSGQDIWYADLNGENWTAASNEIYPLNNVFNNGVVGVADSGRTLYLHGSYSSKPEYQYGLSVTHYENGKWTKPKMVRIKGFNPYSPYLNFYVNDDKGIMVLSFADRKNPKNEDIYVSFRVKKNIWSKPESLGPQINTDSAEFSPFISADGKTLYFSSNGHEGFGSFDVFSAYRLDDTWSQWSTVTNMGEKINSEHFEAYYTQHGTEGYFSSNRDSKLSDLYKAEFEVVQVEKRPEVMASDDMTKEMLFTMKGFLDIKNPGQVGMVRVLDINGNVVERVKPNSDGSFEIKSMNKFSRYSVDLDGQEKEIEDLEIFFVNADGSRVYLNEGIVAGQYPFETLDRDIKAVLMAEVNEDAENALFKFAADGDIPAGASIYLYDENGRQRETAIVNRKGEFSFKSMRNGGVYRIEAEGGTITNDTKVYFVNNSEQIEISGNILKGALFKKLSGSFQEIVEEKKPVASVEEPSKPANPLRNETGSQEMVADNTPELLEEATFGFEYGQLPPEGTRVTLVDENGNIVEESFTDADGLFRFKKLQGDKNYSIKLDEASDVNKDLSMYLVDADGLQRPLAKSVASGGNFVGSVASETVAGEGEEVYSFNYNALPPAGSKVYLTDENDNVIDSSYVDADGNFKFKKLRSDKAYMMRLADSKDASSGLDYFIVDAAGNEHAVSTSQKKGDAITALDETDAAPTISKDKFDKFTFDYANLPKDGSKVYLTDEYGNLVDSSYVDAKGNFRFKKLDPSKSYLFKVDDKDFDMDAAAMYAVSGGERRQLKKLPGSFSYDRMALIAVKDTKLDVSKFQIEYDGEIPDQAQAYLYDEETNEIIETAEIEEDGSFSFRKLNPDRKYNVKFDEEIDNSKAKYFPIEVVELVEKRKPTPLKPNESFALVPPVNERKETIQVKEDDIVNKTVFEDPSELEAKPLADLNADWVLYFGFNEFLLSPENIVEVKKIAKTLREDETLVVRVEGHADNVGSEDINYRMSVLRISNVIYHLEMRGIDETRMEVKPFGELMPIADNATEEGRAKNRRVEIHISKK